MQDQLMVYGGYTYLDGRDSIGLNWGQLIGKTRSDIPKIKAGLCSYFCLVIKYNTLINNKMESSYRVLIEEVDSQQLSNQRSIMGHSNTEHGNA